MAHKHRLQSLNFYRRVLALEVRDEALEIRQRSQLRVNRLVAAFFGADGLGAAHVVGLSLEEVVLALTE